EAAHSLARRLVRREPASSIAQILLGLDAFKRRDFANADVHFRAAQRNAPPDEPTIRLARAWLAVAQGHTDKAIAALQNEAKSAWAKHFEVVQRAFMADVAKKKEMAAEAYGAIYDKKAPNTRIAEAYARHLGYWGNNSQAQALLEEANAGETPLGKVLMAELR